MYNYNFDATPENIFKLVVILLIAQYVMLVVILFTGMYEKKSDLLVWMIPFAPLFKMILR